MRIFYYPVPQQICFTDFSWTHLEIDQGSYRNTVRSNSWHTRRMHKTNENGHFWSKCEVKRDPFSRSRGAVRDPSFHINLLSYLFESGCEGPWNTYTCTQHTKWTTTTVNNNEKTDLSQQQRPAMPITGHMSHSELLITSDQLFSQQQHQHHDTWPIYRATLFLSIM